jgi:hypothetical protein
MVKWAHDPLDWSQETWKSVIILTMPLTICVTLDSYLFFQPQFPHLYYG